MDNKVLYIEALERFDWPVFWAIGTNRFDQNDRRWIESVVNGVIWGQVIDGTYLHIRAAAEASINKFQP